MPVLIEITKTQIIYAAPAYPRSQDETEAMGLAGKRNEEMRALTIAAFRVAQNNSQLSQRQMDKDLLLHAVAGSTSALNYWVKQSRLKSDILGYTLTAEGLAECQNTLLGHSGSYSTTEEKVQEWVSRLLSGDAVATQAKVFQNSAWEK